MKKKTMSLLLFFGALLASCATNKTDSGKSDESQTSSTSQGDDSAKKIKEGAFYKPNGFATTCYVIPRSSLTSAEFVLIQSLQGILAQNKATIFISGMGEKDATFTEMSEKLGFSVVEIEDPWELLRIHKKSIVNQKFVTYTSTDKGDAYDNSINRAATIAGVEQWIMVENSLVSQCLAEGFKLGSDASNMTDAEVFHKYKEFLNNTYLVNQKPSSLPLRDYGIAGASLSTYVDYIDDDLRKEISEWTCSNCPVFGWTENEGSFVAYNSNYSMVTIAADWSGNLSFMAAEDINNDLVPANRSKSTIKAEEGKHYVTIVMSDGDNVQWLQRGFETDSKYYGSKYRGKFKMNWTMAPSLSDVAPYVMESIYDKATTKDDFICGPSGFGYVNVNDYNESTMEDYAAKTAGYCEKSGLSVLNFIDNYVSSSYLDYFTKYDNIKGGLWSVSDYYVQGGDTGAGGVYWSNDKPFVCFRDTLWRVSGSAVAKYYGYTERVAQRINDRSTDIHSIEAYSAVVCHAWSIGTMEYINRFVEQLDDHVEVVNAGEFIDLITENVPHQDVEEVLDHNPFAYSDDELCAIETDPFYWNDVKDTPVTNKKAWDFSSGEQSDWALGCGGLQYDSAKYTSDGIYLDGSDLDDRDDYIPNAYAYTMRNWSNEDKKITMVAKSGSATSDVNLRVRLYLEDPNSKRGASSINLVANEWDKAKVNQYGYYLFQSGEFQTFTFDLSSYDLAGKKGLLVFESDDSGEGSGEIVRCKSISIE